MRHFRTGAGKVPALDSNTLHLWTCDESAATDDLRDLAGGEDLAGSNSPGVTTGNAGGARTFNGTDQDFLGGNTGDDSGDLIGACTIDIGFFWDGTGGGGSVGSQLLLAYDGSGSGASANTLIAIYLNQTTGVLHFYWQYGTGTAVSFDSTEALVRGRRYVVSIVREVVTSTTQRILIYVGGQLISTSSAVHAPETDASANQTWFVAGFGASYTAYFAGHIDFIRVSKTARTSSECRTVAEEADALALASRVKVEVEDSAGAMQDVSDYFGQDWLRSVDLADSADTRVETAKIVLQMQQGRASLARWNDNVANRYPLPSASAIGPDSTTYTDPSGSTTELLALGRAVKIYAAQGQFSTTWEQIFEGTLDSVEWGGDAVSIACSDNGGLLSRGYHEDTNKYSAATLESMIQAILTRAASQGWIASAPTLSTPEASAWNMDELVQGREPLLQAVNKLADLRGWLVKYKWDDDSRSYKLTLWGPRRVDAVERLPLPESQLLKVARASLSLKNIRNVVRVGWQSDTATTGGTGYSGEGGGPDGSGSSSPAYIEVPADGTYQPFGESSLAYDSIGQYGRQFCEVVQGAGENINTLTEAKNLADTMLCDLSRPEAELSLETRTAIAQIEIGDMLAIPADDVHLSQELALAVFSMRHHWDKDGSKSTLQVRGLPATQGAGHLSKEIRSTGALPGIFKPIDAEMIPSQRLALQSRNRGFNRSERARARGGLLQNGGFEFHDFPQDDPDGWTLSGYTSVDTSSKADGVRSIAWSGVGSITSGVFPVQPGALRISGLVGSSAASVATVNVYVYFYSDRGSTYISSTYQNMPVSTTFKENSFPAAVPSTARFAKIYVTATPAGSETLYISRVDVHPQTFWAKAHSTATQTLTKSTTPTALTLGGEVDYWGAVASSTFTAPADGFYRIRARAELECNYVTTARLLIKANSSWAHVGPVVDTTTLGATNNRAYLDETVLRELSAGDTITLAVLNTYYDMTAQSGGQTTFMRVERVEDRER